MIRSVLAQETTAAEPARDAFATLDALGLTALSEWMAAHPLVALGAGLAVLCGVAWLSLFAVRRVVLRVVAAFARRTPTFWDQVLFDREVFQRAAWAVPLVIFAQGIALVPFLPGEISGMLHRLAVASLLLVLVRAFAALLAAVNEIYSRYPMAKERPIKGLLQVVSVLAHMAVAVMIVATLMDRSPIIFFSSLGAMTAILLLVFRDSILSLVAGIQITTNDLLRVGDWIEMPQFGADGDVIDIALNSVRVQNWDRTFTVIPTHKFLEHSFKNWRGMTESGGRRIKRSFHIDTSTIRFLTDEEIRRFSKFVLLEDYMKRKVEELEEYNRIHCPDPSFTANARRLTNVGTLRAYLVAYLRQHPRIRQDMTLLVRQLQPTPEGLPIEIYVFTNDIAWANYEGIQADIFDHVLAMTPEFGLRVFQPPSGWDLKEAIRERTTLQPA